MRENLQTGFNKIPWFAILKYIIKYVNVMNIVYMMALNSQNVTNFIVDSLSYLEYRVV